MGGQIEILFPIAEVNDPPTKAWFVDGGANQSWSPIFGSGGSFAPGAQPHQIGTDTLLPTPPPPPPPPPVDICALTSVGGRWNPDFLCSTNTKLANDNLNMLFDGFGDFGSGGQCASTTSHSRGGGKFYFELEYVTGSASGAYLRAAIDFNAMLLWFAPQGQFDIRDIVGIGTTQYCHNQAVSYVAQPGFDPGGQSIGFGTEIGSFGYNWWFEGGAFKNGHIASTWITWDGQPDNVDNPSDPATGVGGLDISFLPGGDYHIVCMMWDFGLSDSQILIRTADTPGGFLFAPPNGFCPW